jgi:SNF2 family DNA or RNA helicase
LARIEYNRNTPLKTTMIGDDAGLGKTFPAMMAVVKAVYESAGVKMPSIIVVPSSCVPQWKSEFEKFFKPVCITSSP